MIAARRRSGTWSRTRADTAPGQANGNGMDGFGAKWYAIEISGSAAPVSSPSSSGGGGYGY